MISVRNALITAASLGLAVLAGVDAWARLPFSAASEVSGVLPIGSGPALASRAQVIVQQSVRMPERQGAEPVIALTASQRREVIDLSLAAYRREPLSNLALRNLGLVAAAAKDLPGARKYLRTAVKITRRDLPANSWLARDYALLGDEENALESYDQALRTNEQAQELLLPVLLTSLQQRELVEPVVSLLAKQPPWQNAFWARAPHHREALGNIGRVREAIARRGIQVREDYDRALIPELANAGHLAVADRLVRMLTREGDRKGEAVRDSEFDTPIGLEPFGWQLFFTSLMSSDIDRTPGVLRISTFSDGGGRAARQVVALPGGAYRLSVKAADWDRLDKDALYLRLECAETANPGISTTVSIDSAALTRLIRKPRAGCTYFWLTVFARQREDRQDNIVTIEQISLRAV